MKLLVALWGTLFAFLIALFGYGLAAWLFSQATGWGLWIAAWVTIWLTTAALVIAIAHAVVVITRRHVLANGELIPRPELVSIQVSPEPTELLGVRLVKLPGAAPLLVRQGSTRRFAREVLLSGFHGFTDSGAKRATQRVAGAVGLELDPRVAGRQPRHATVIDGAAPLAAAPAAPEGSATVIDASLRPTSHASPAGRPPARSPQSPTDSGATGRWL